MHSLRGNAHPINATLRGKTHHAKLKQKHLLSSGHDLLFEVLRRHEPHILIRLFPPFSLLQRLLRTRMQHDPVSRLLAVKAKSRVEGLKQRLRGRCGVGLKVLGVRPDPVRFKEDSLVQVNGLAGRIYGYELADLVP